MVIEFQMSVTGIIIIIIIIVMKQSGLDRIVLVLVRYSILNSGRPTPGERAS